MVAGAAQVDRRHPLPVSRSHKTMTPKPSKKPTQAELIQRLLAQVAELRGRIERLEARAVPVEKYPEQPAAKTVWWSWFSGG